MKVSLEMKPRRETLNTFMHTDTHHMHALAHPKIWLDFSPILDMICPLLPHSFLMQYLTSS